MSSANLLWHGLELMLVGMGTVFLFLTLLVLATALMSRLVVRWESAAGIRTSGGGEPEEVAAIAAAIAEHRRRGR